MSIIDKLIGILAPHDCLGCGEEGSLLCAKCLSDLPAAEVPSSALKIQAVTLYQGIAKDLIWKLKSDGAQEAARIMARAMAKFAPAGVLVVPVPTASTRVRQRGYDQAKLLARHLARQAGLPYANALARQGQAHQVGASRPERLRQLSDAFRVKRPGLVRGEHIILIDDVTTTGATLETVAKLLIDAGAANVEAVTFAYAKRRSTAG